MTTVRDSRLQESEVPTIFMPLTFVTVGMFFSFTVSVDWSILNLQTSSKPMFVRLGNL